MALSNTMDSMDWASALPEADLSSGCAFVTWPTSFEPRLMLLPSAALESLSFVAVTGSPGLALRASTGLDSVAFISEPLAAAACACLVLADAAEALLLLALAPLRFALTAVPDVVEASPCAAGPSANAVAVVASRAHKNMVELFIEDSFWLGGTTPYPRCSLQSRLT